MDRLLGVNDRRGVSTTGGGVGAERTFVVVAFRLWVSYPDAWSSDGSNASVVSAISWRMRSHIEGPISSSTCAVAMFSKRRC